jgi:hypothetical protein
VSIEQRVEMVEISESIGLALARELKVLGYVLVNEQMLIDALRGANELLLWEDGDIESGAAAMMHYLRNRQ